MLSDLRRLAFGFVAIAASALALSGQPVFAQPETQGWFEEHKDPYEIEASDVVRYAGYYSPYAIMAAATNLPVKDFDDIREAIRANKLREGSDVEYAVHGVFSSNIVKDQTIVTGAEAALNPWQYQFGSESGSSCYDPNDGVCRHLIPKNRNHPPGPPFQVWARVSPQPANLFGLLGPMCAEFSIVFRGTREHSSMDWLSNGRYFGTESLYHLDSSYTWLHRNIDAIIRNIAAQPCYRASSPPLIVSVGHSLGGGLAVHAALANDPHQPRIEKVFAFEPSPETGADLAQETLNENRTGLEIDRVDHLGEASSKLEGWAKFARFINWNSEEFYPSADNRCKDKLLVRKVHVQAFVRKERGIIAAIKRAFVGDTELHTIAPLAAELIELDRGVAAESRGRPAAPDDCPTRYEVRKHDQEQQEAKSNAQVSILSPAVVPPPQSPAVVAPSQPPPVVPVPPQTQVTSLGAQRAPYAPAQVAGPGLWQALFGAAQAAEVGGRRGFHPAPRTQVAVLDQRRAQVVSADARLTRVTASGARGQFDALAQTESVDLDQRQVSAANLGARRRSSATPTQLSDRDAQPVLISTAPSWRARTLAHVARMLSDEVRQAQ